MNNNLTCKDCKNFVGGGDFGLCCKVKDELCYEDTPACEEFIEDIFKEKDYLNVDHWNISGEDAEFRREKYKQQRISRGFSDWDWLDLDMFLTNLLSASLRYYANHTSSWSPVMTPTLEDYKARIIKLADRFETMANWGELHEERTDYKEIYNELHQYTKETFAELAEVFWRLWD